MEEDDDSFDLLDQELDDEEEDKKMKVEEKKKKNALGTVGHGKFFKITLWLIKIEKRHFTPELENISIFFSDKKVWSTGRNFSMHGQKADFTVFFLREHI